MRRTSSVARPFDGPAQAEHRERVQPHEVLGREDLAERDERDQRREGEQDEVVRRPPPRREQHDAREHDGEDDREDRRHGVGRAAREAVRLEVVRMRGGPGDVAAADDAEHRRGRRLDLDRPVEMESHAVDEARAGERQEDDEHDGREGEHPPPRGPPFPATEQPRARDERDQPGHELRRGAQPEQGERRGRPVAQQERDAADRHRRRKHVEMRPHERAEQERHRDHQPGRAAARDRGDRALQGERGDEHLRAERDRVAIRQRRPEPARDDHREDRERRVLEREA